MKSSIAPCVLSLVMKCGNIIPFVGGVESRCRATSRRILVENPAFDSQWVRVGPKVNDIVGFDQGFHGFVAVNSDATVVATGRGENNGDVRAYKNEAGSLTQMGSTFVGGASGYTSSFPSLSGDGKVLAIAASIFDPEVQDDKMGHVRVFQYDDSNDTWIQQQSDIKEDGEKHTGFFGTFKQLQLSRDGKTLVVGNLDYNEKKGMCSIYKYNGSAWEKVQVFLGGNINITQSYAVYDFYDKVGVNAVSDDGSVLAIASMGNFVTIYVYDAALTKYISEKVIEKTAGSVDIDFGASLSIASNGKTLAVGAPQTNENENENDFTGQAHIYEKNLDGEWVQKGQPITGNVLNELSSFAIILSDDGNTVALSSKNYDESKGRVRVFDFIHGDWTQRDNHVEGTASGDMFADFGLSGDGNTIFAGALIGKYAATYKHLQDWKIYQSNFKMGATSNSLDVYHLIGDGPVSVSVKLYSKHCIGNPIANDVDVDVDVDVVSLIDDTYIADEHKLTHKLTFDTTKINSSPNQLVHFAGTTADGITSQNSIGSIEFCTLVQTFMTSNISNNTITAVTSFKTNYKIDFDLTEGETFSNTNTIVADNEDEQQTNLDIDLTVTAFFCGADSFVQQAKTKIQQNERIYVCLEPKSHDTKISNLYMTLKTEDNFEYQPIEFGTTSWESDAITEVTEDPDSDVVRAHLFPVASLFTNERTLMTIQGKVFLEFKNPARRMFNFARYDMTVELEAIADENSLDRLKGIINSMFCRLYRMIMGKYIST